MPIPGWNPACFGYWERSLVSRGVRLVFGVTGSRGGGRGMGRHSKGFSLIELLIVVAIILIIAAIAIPNLLRSRIAANQASAIGSIRVLNTAEVTSSSTYDAGFSRT